MSFDQAQSSVWPFAQRGPKGGARHDRYFGIHACNRIAMIGSGEQRRLGQRHSSRGNVERKCGSIRKWTLKCDYAGSNKIHRMNAILPAKENGPLIEGLHQRVTKYMLPV